MTGDKRPFILLLSRTYIYFILSSEINVYQKCFSADLILIFSQLLLTCNDILSNKLNTKSIPFETPYGEFNYLHRQRLRSASQ